MGFMLLALGVCSEEAIDSFIFYLIQYSLTSVSLFFILVAFGSLMTDSDNYSPVQYIAQLNGQFYLNPLLGVSLAITLFSMAGVPPLAGFFGKLMVIYAALHKGYLFLALSSVMASVVSAAYYLLVIKVVFFDPLDSKLDTFGDNSKGVRLMYYSSSTVPRHRSGYVPAYASFMNLSTSDVYRSIHST
jgi:NADH-ubiquinone oxidoreductase chain 2